VVCSIISTVVSGSLPMMDPIHGSEGSMGIITLASHTFMPWAMDSRQQ
jgi:hypothetical protein